MGKLEDSPDGVAKQEQEEKDFAVKKAKVWFGYKWPEKLTSGIMFFEGHRISKKEFEECSPPRTKDE